MAQWRIAEKLLAVYFAYAAAVAFWLPLDARIQWGVALLNAALIAGYCALARAEERGLRWVSYFRDWYILPQMLLAYKEMGWFALPHADFALERAWLRYDHLVLYDLGLKRAIESLGPVLPSLLEISYSLVYAIAAFYTAALYLTGRRRLVDTAHSAFLIGILSAYALFPYFPSEPPRTVFAGQDLPAHLTIFRQFNLWLLGGYGIHTSVFPSAHVSGAFAGAFAVRRLLPERPWIGRMLLALAVSIATATVYGRYHFVVDALAGLALAFLADWWIRRRLSTLKRWE